MKSQLVSRLNIQLIVVPAKVHFFVAWIITILQAPPNLSCLNPPMSAVKNHLFLRKKKKIYSFGGVKSLNLCHRSVPFSHCRPKVHEFSHSIQLTPTIPYTFGIDKHHPVSHRPEISPVWRARARHCVCPAPAARRARAGGPGRGLGVMGIPWGWVSPRDFHKWGNPQ